MTTLPNPNRGFRFPAEVIEYAVWLYHCFSLSLRDAELILATRGVVVSDESIREWGLRFGRRFADAPKRRRPKPGDKWRLSEVFIRICGKLHPFWCAMDRNRVVLDSLAEPVQRHRAAIPRREVSEAWFRICPFRVTQAVRRPRPVGAGFRLGKGVLCGRRPASPGQARWG